MKNKYKNGTRPVWLGSGAFFAFAKCLDKVIKALCKGKNIDGLLKSRGVLDVAKVNNSGFNRNKKIWIVVALTIFAIVFTLIVLGELLSKLSADDRHAIDLVPEGIHNSSDDVDSNKESNGADKEGSDEDDSPVKTGEEKEDSETSENGENGESESFVPYLNVDVYDEDGMWTTNTTVSIFEMAYENGTMQVTVEGNGDKVIAPGTENAYTFYLKNNSNVAIDYNLAMESFFTPLDQMIPVKVRLKGYDGTYLLGSEDVWEDVEKLNEISEWVTIGVNRYAYYTLEWMWPFESGDDEYDTYLGDFSVEDTLELTVNIQTVSTVSANMDYTGGGLPTKTGDTTNIWMYVGIMGVSLIAVLIIIIIRRREDDEDEE